jgi:1-acyl-sn-glycerol-3-phosphate acyltransferase
MIRRAKHNYFIYNFFKLYTVWKIRRNFHKVLIKGEFADRKLPVLIISNHISWWDGFWAEYLNLKVFHRKFFYFMMLEEQLNKNNFLNYTGGFSIKKKSKSIIETLYYTAGLLENNRNLVLIFPQGEIQSLYNNSVQFDKGLEFILKKTTGKVHLVFLVSLIDYFSSQKPGLYMYYTEYHEEEMTIRALEKEYGLFYSQCRSGNIEMNKSL